MAKRVYFWRVEDDNGEFCQWYHSEFKVSGDSYVTAEQFMMAEKARLFNDEDSRLKILKCKDPKQQKSLGRKVKNFVEDVWQANCQQIVYEGNMAKFGQNAALKEFLLNTGDAMLVEASPLDAIWGIGLDAAHARQLNVKDWPGKNLLGIALMRVRDSLREAEQREEKKE